MKSLVKRLYDYKEAEKPRPATAVVGSTSTYDKKDDYADFYARMKILKKEKTWSDENFNYFLSHREQGDKEYNEVSK